MSNVQFTGQIWNPSYIREAIAQASDETLAQGAAIARQATPIDTGYMASRWQAKAGSLTNDAPYSGYVEARRLILRSTIPRMEKEFGVRLAKRIT